MKKLFTCRLICPNRRKASGIERQEHTLLRFETNRPNYIQELRKLTAARICGKCGAKLEAR